MEDRRMRICSLYRLILLSLFAGILLLGNVRTSMATHSHAMEMFYRWQIDSSYQFTLIFYRNCQGFTATAPASVTISATSVSLASSGIIMCPMLPTTGPGAPPLTPPNLFNCSPSNFACAEEYVYRGNWFSPGRADDWIFSYELCCINVTNAPTNVVNGTMRVECGLNNLDFPDTLHKNISGIFHNRRPDYPSLNPDTVINPPLVSICEARNIYLDQSVRNYDGDSISYKFFWPQTNGGAPNAYINGYSFAYPLPFDSILGPLKIDSLTGEISFISGTPTGTGVYMLGVQATEYRKDTTGPSDTMRVIGFVKRNLSIYLTDTANCPSQTVTFADNSANRNATDSVFYPCPGQIYEVNLTEHVKCNSIDIDGSCLQLRDPFTAAVIPIDSVFGINCTKDQLTNTLRLKLSSVLSIGNYELIIKTGNDGNTLLTECYQEIQPFKDTLHFIIENQPVGVLLGDKIGPGNFNTYMQVECEEKVFDLNLSNFVLCSSISSNGSDFELYDPASNNVIPVTGVNKNCSGGKTRQIQLSTNVMDPGNYWLRLKAGTDNNRLLNLCQDEWAADSILMVSTGLYPNLGKDTVKCEEDSTFQYFLNPGQFYTYYWSTGNNAPSIFVSIPTTYWVKVTNLYGCTATDTMVLAEKKCYTGISSHDENKVSIYPNPTNSYIYLDSDKKIDPLNINIYNLIGEEIDFEADFAESKLRIDMSTFQEGVYVVKVCNDQNKCSMQKIIYRKE